MVKVWQEKVIIPTYKTGKPDKNPMFLEKRVYQGSSGVVYPHAVIDKVYDEKEKKEWTALFLENEYLKVMILPELGGRIQMAYDKTNNYHFVYYNHVIKPALVGLAGPWISGGIEFNWPQHHRPSTFDATDYIIKENEDGSKTVTVNEYEIMFGTKCALSFTLYPGVAYIELHAQLYNRTSFPQTFLWWANPAVGADEYYQSVFPPDVHAVYDHGKRDVSSFPIATGTYYKVNYAPGTDISRYINIPVPTSYMTVNSAFNFVGGYHHQKKAGLMHIADHHISPGKKQWTWGNGDFGKAWDKQLTDNDGPYIELMCGVYTDNQPDFSWIMPNETRSFKQYFMPYKNIGYVKNASIDAMINVERDNDKAVIKVYSTKKRKISIHINLNDTMVVYKVPEVSPTNTYEKVIDTSIHDINNDISSIEVYDDQGQLLVDYKPMVKQENTLPKPAKAIPLPYLIKTNEELFLAGLHLEQYRHATYDALDYYKEALKRDNTDIRCNNAMGLWHLRRAQFQKAEKYLRNAIQKLTIHNPNPYNGEPLYSLGICLKYQEKYKAAFDCFYKSCWNAAMQDNAYLQLAYLSAKKKNWKEVLFFADQSILKNYHSLKARHIKTIALRKLGKLTSAKKIAEETIVIDPFDFATRYELAQCYTELKDDSKSKKELSLLKELARANSNTYIEMALQYADAGLYSEAVEFLNLNSYPDTLQIYYTAYFLWKNNDVEKGGECFKRAFNCSPDKVFPNRVEDVIVLQKAIDINPVDYKALYYIGNYYYAKRIYHKAKTAWEKSIEINNQFATTLRNLGIAYYNKFDKKQEALQLFEQAFAADPSDTRILYELMQLYKRFNKDPQEIIEFLNGYKILISDRDDLYIDYVSLHSVVGRFQEAKDLFEKRVFHPWEGGEGKTSSQHIFINIELAKIALQNEQSEKAEALLIEAQNYPENLGEGKIYGAQENDIFYWLGCVYSNRNQDKKAIEYWEKASVGLNVPTPAIYYNDQQPDRIFYQGLALLKLGREKEASERFNNLINYGTTHLNDDVKIDFFAVSLPDLMIFDDDLNLRNKIHCYYLIGLGNFGLNNMQDAREYFDKVLSADPYHMGASIHTKMI